MSYGRPSRNANWDLSSDGERSTADEPWNDFPMHPRSQQHLGTTTAGYPQLGRTNTDHSDFSASAAQLSFDRQDIPYGAELQSTVSDFHRSMPSFGVGVGVNTTDESGLFLNVGSNGGADNYQTNHRRETQPPQLPPPRAGRALPPPSKTEEPAAPFTRKSNRFKFPVTRKADSVVGRPVDPHHHPDPLAVTITCEHCNVVIQVPAGATALVTFCTKCKNVTPNISTSNTKSIAASFASVAP